MLDAPAVTTCGMNEADTAAMADLNSEVQMGVTNLDNIPDRKPLPTSAHSE